MSNEKMIPVSEAIRYRCRAQKAEALVEDLQAQLVGKTITRPVDDGGPAFPLGVVFDEGKAESPESYPYERHVMGMTLLDYFAAHETSTPSENWLGDWEYIEGQRAKKDPVYIQRGMRQALTGWKYECAAAMLAERKRVQQ